jgi:hypothetical protein
MALLDKMSVDDLMKVRKMKAADALEFLDTFNLSGPELSQAKKLVQVQDKHHDNRLWLATAWLLGASFSMLAKDKGVAKQSIMNQVDKLIPVEERAKGRIGGMMSYEALSEYKVAYFEHVDELRSLSPKEAAGWLITNVSLDQ